jgi:hypothetical protein
LGQISKTSDVADAVPSGRLGDGLTRGEFAIWRDHLAVRTLLDAFIREPLTDDWLRGPRGPTGPRRFAESPAWGAHVKTVAAAADKRDAARGVAARYGERQRRDHIAALLWYSVTAAGDDHLSDSMRWHLHVAVMPPLYSIADVNRRATKRGPYQPHHSELRRLEIGAAAIAWRGARRCIVCGRLLGPNAEKTRRACWNHPYDLAPQDTKTVLQAVEAARYLWRKVGRTIEAGPAWTAWMCDSVEAGGAGVV